MLEAGVVVSDRYRLQKRLGRNAGRQTWLAQDLQTETNESVVLKLLAFGGDVQWEDLKLFEREGQILKQLDHPRIPKYRDYFAIDDRTLWFGLVQEYIPGASLRELLNLGKRFTEAEARQIAKEVLEILIYLHGLHPPLLHRDIKPNNLVSGDDQQIYLVDFGAVQDRAALEGASFTVVGTYGYTPMEQFGGRATPASDLYALGATIIHLLTRTTPADLPNSDLRIQFRQLLEIQPHFADWLSKMAEPALERRFQTAKEALHALELELETGIIGNIRCLSAPSLPVLDTGVKPPINTDVQLYKYPKYLEINLPMRGIRSLMDLGAAAFVVVSTVSLLLLTTASPFMLLFPVSHFLLLWGIFSGLKHLLSKSQLKFNLHFFEITYNLLFFKYRQKGITQNIQDISVKYQSTIFNSGEIIPQSLIINSKSNWQSNKFERYLFGQGLTEEELIWLAQEIRSWLSGNSKL